MDAVDLTLAHEGWRAPGVDPLPLDRMGQLLAPQRPEMLQPPVGEVRVQLDGDLDPFRVRVVEIRALGRGVDREDLRLRRLDRTEIGHGARIPDEGWRDFCE